MESYNIVMQSETYYSTSLFNLHLNEYSQEFHYYPFVVKSDKCVGSYNTLNDLSNKVWVQTKTED